MIKKIILKHINICCFLLMLNVFVPIFANNVITDTVNIMPGIQLLPVIDSVLIVEYEELNMMELQTKLTFMNEEYPVERSNIPVEFTIQEGIEGMQTGFFGVPDTSILTYTNEFGIATCTLLVMEPVLRSSVFNILVRADASTVGYPELVGRNVVDFTIRNDTLQLEFANGRNHLSRINSDLHEPVKIKVVNSDGLSLENEVVFFNLLDVYPPETPNAQNMPDSLISDMNGDIEFNITSGEDLCKYTFVACPENGQVTYQFNVFAGEIELRDGEELETPDDEGDIYSYIASDCEMPELNLRYNTVDTDTFDIQYRLKVQYRKYYNNDPDTIIVLDHYTYIGDDVDSVVNDFKPIRINSDWSIADQLGDVFLGGKATLSFKSENATLADTSFVFHIRGNNPSDVQFRNHIDNLNWATWGWTEMPWFLYKLMRHESDTPVGSSWQQFNYVNNDSIGPDFTDFRLCPCWGYPSGFGIMMCDPTHNTTQRWSWHANVQEGLTRLRSKQITADDKYDGYISSWILWNQRNPNNQKPMHAQQAEGSITYTYQPSGDQKSFRDATWIKHYNGSSKPGSPRDGYYLTWDTSVSSNPKWVIHNLNNLIPPRNYVQLVSNSQP